MAGSSLPVSLSASPGHVCSSALVSLVLLVGTSACTSRTASAINVSNNHGQRSTGPTLVHIPVSHDGYAAHAEPYLAVNPHNPRNLLGTAQTFRSATSLPRAGTFASFDGGRTWPQQVQLPMPSTLPTAQDTTVAFNARGVGFVAAMIRSIVNGRPGDVISIAIWQTNNGGRRFHRPVILARGRRLDHPWLTADPAGKTLYLVWSDQVRNTIMFSRSADGGSRFSPGRTIYRGGIVSDQVVAAGSGGRVAVAFYHSRDGRRFSIGVVASSNQGQSFGGFRPIPQTGRDHLLYNGRSDPSSRLGAALDPRTGMLYVIYAAYGRAGHTDVLLSRLPGSRRTWFNPVRVDNAPADTHTINQQPQVAVGREGRVYVSYLSQREFRMDLYLGESTSHGAGFERTIRVTSRSFDPSLGIRTFRPGSWWIGDYQGLACGPRAVYPFWNDTRTGRLEIFTAVIPESLIRRDGPSAARAP